MADTTFKVDDKALKLAFKKMPGALLENLHQAFNRSLAEFEGVMVKERFGPFGGPPWYQASGDHLASRSGNLRGTLGFEVPKVSSLGKLRGVAFIGDAKTPYAAIQERGGTIFGSPWLTIPLPDNKTASGDARFKSAAALRADSSVKTWIQRSQAGNLIIKGFFPGKPIQNLWILKRSVTIQPRLRFGRTFEDQYPRQVRSLNKAVQTALKSATKGAS